MIEYLNFYLDGENNYTLYVGTNYYYWKEFSSKFGKNESETKGSLFLLLKYETEYENSSNWYRLPKTFFKGQQKKSDLKIYENVLGSVINVMLQETNNFEIEQNWDYNFLDFLKEFFQERKD